jgi:ureidoglycolate hydrolase
MDTIPSSLLEIHAYDGPGYLPLVDFGTWRVALMNYTPDLAPEKIHCVQRHDETDEVFVLLNGRCILFLVDDAGRVLAEDMQPYRLYNVRRGVWHSHTFSPDAKVLIVENCDTTDENSPFHDLTAEQQEDIITLAKRLWG